MSSNESTPSRELASNQVNDMAGVGAELGKYRLLAELGHGGMSTVYLALARGPSGFNKLVVLKLLSAPLASDPKFLTMFLDEARLAACLNHPNVVQTNEVGCEGGRHLLAMEYLEGQPLSAILRRARSPSAVLSLAARLRVIADACAGLHYAHEHTDLDGTKLQLVHRDISPQNIFVTYEGGVKVLDFGIAKAVTSSTRTLAGVIKGKIAYLAPEQISGEPVDRRTDVYGMGVVLWEALAGQRMWRGKSDIQIMQAVLMGNLEPPSSVATHPHAAWLDAIVMKALARHPEARYPNVRLLQEELEALLGELPPLSSREVGRYVADAFRDHRMQLRSIVERELSAAKRLQQASGDGASAYVSSRPSISKSMTKSADGDSPATSPVWPLRRSRVVVLTLVALALVLPCALAAYLLSSTSDPSTRATQAVPLRAPAPQTSPGATVAPGPAPLPTPAPSALPTHGAEVDASTRAPTTEVRRKAPLRVAAPRAPEPVRVQSPSPSAPVTPTTPSGRKFRTEL